MAAVAFYRRLRGGGMSVKLNPRAPIGIFDSGPGGLAVLREVIRLLPNENILFLGDTARQPYGPRPVEKVRQFTIEITGYLIQQGVKMVIIACDTASVAGWRAAQRCFPDVPVLGMVVPGVRAALDAGQSSRIGVWGTAITIESKAYDKFIRQLRPDTEVLGVACPKLLRLAEKGKIDNRPYLLELAHKCFQPLADFQADCLILGCTDLTCVRDIAKEVAGEGVTVVDPAEEVVREARQILEDVGGLGPRKEGSAHYQFLITGDDTANFAAFAARFLSIPEVGVEQVAVAEVQQAVAGLSQDSGDSARFQIADLGKGMQF